MWLHMVSSLPWKLLLGGKKICAADALRKIERKAYKKAALTQGRQEEKYEKVLAVLLIALAEILEQQLNHFLT